MTMTCALFARPLRNWSWHNLELVSPLDEQCERFQLRWVSLHLCGHSAGGPVCESPQAGYPVQYTARCKPNCPRWLIKGAIFLYITSSIITSFIHALGCDRSSIYNSCFPLSCRIIGYAPPAIDRILDIFGHRELFTKLVTHCPSKPEQQRLT